MILRNKKLIASIVLITIGVMNITGCSKFKYENKKKIDSENVQKKDANSGVLKVISEQEFSLKDLSFKAGSLFFDKNNELYFIGRSEDKDLYLEGKIILDNEKIKVEESYIAYKDKKYGYEFEVISEDKALIKHYTNLYEEWEVNLKTLNDNNFFENGYIEKVIKGEIYGKFQIGNNKIVLAIAEKFEEIGKYEKILIYDLKSEKWQSIDIPKKVYLESFIGIFDNKIIYSGSNEEEVQFPSHIGVIDLEKNKMFKPMESNVGVDSICVLDENNVLVKGYSEKGESIEILNLKNKVIKTLTNLNFESENFIANAENSNRFSYVEKNENGLWHVVVCTLNGDEIEGKNIIYSYENDETVIRMVWSSDDKVLALGEAIGDNPLTTLKIFKFK